MAILWGDVARGFTGALREDYKRTRERNERVIDAGINRAIDRGTKLYDKRKETEKEYRDRVNYLLNQQIGYTPEHIATVASLGDDDWSTFKVRLNEFTSDTKNKIEDEILNKARKE